MVEKKNYIKVTIMVAVLLVAFLLPAQAGSGGSDPRTDKVDCSFTVMNAHPTDKDIHEIELYDENESNTVNEMNPQEEYALKIVASDPNGAEDIKKIFVTIYDYGTLQKSPTRITEGDANSSYLVIYEWTKGEGWSLLAPTNSTWGINSNKSRGPEIQSSNISVGTWWLHFKPGKVAKESENWRIFVIVTDENVSFDNRSYVDRAEGYLNRTIRMNWYGEIEVLDETISFDELFPRTERSRVIDVNTISNGKYKIEGKTDAQWGTIIVNTTSMTPGPGQMVLLHKCYDSSCDPGIVSTTFTVIPGLDLLDGPTSEKGKSYRIELKLRLGYGILPGTYSGTYYVQIANA